MAPHASPTILTVLGAALSTAARIALFDGSLTGPAGAGGMSANTSGNPKRLKNWRTSASRDGGRGRTLSNLRMMADPRISVLTCGIGPFTRLTARNQVASSPATTATTEPAAESTPPRALRRARAHTREPTSHP